MLQSAEMARADYCGVVCRTIALAATVIVAFDLQAVHAQSVRAERPNIILIMADDIGYECFGCYGSRQYKTPNIDSMAQRGMRFDHCYSQPLCTPSRVKLMTGLSNVRNYSAFSVLNKDQKTIGHYFQEAGYETMVAGKWQLLGAEQYSESFRLRGTWPQDAGFDRHCLWQVDLLGPRYAKPLMHVDGKSTQYQDEGSYGPDVAAQYILEFMKQPRDKPFFIYYPMILVHSPFVPTPDSRPRPGAHQMMELLLVIGVGAWLACTWRYRARMPRVYWIGGALAVLSLVFFHLTYGGKKQGNFEEMVAHMDKIVGQIVDQTEQLGMAENTLILLTGDNGTHRDIRSRLEGVTIQGGKGMTTDAGTRVPLVALWPGVVPAGQVCGDLVDYSDFLPTCLTAAGAPLNASGDGASFLPQLRGEHGQPRPWIYCYYFPRPERGKPTRFVRDQRWKLYGDGRFYNVSQDPLESHPLKIAGLPQAAAAAHGKLSAAMESMPADGQTLLEFSTTAAERKGT